METLWNNYEKSNELAETNERAEIQEGLNQIDSNFRFEQVGNKYLLEYDWVALDMEINWKEQLIAMASLTKWILDNHKWSHEGNEYYVDHDWNSFDIFVDNRPLKLLDTAILSESSLMENLWLEHQNIRNQTTKVAEYMAQREDIVRSYVDFLNDVTSYEKELVEVRWTYWLEISNLRREITKAA